MLYYISRLISRAWGEHVPWECLTVQQPWETLIQFANLVKGCGGHSHTLVLASAPAEFADT